MEQQPTPYTYAGTHKRKVKTFTILSRVFLPLGIVFLVLGAVLLGVGIPGTITSLEAMEQSGECVRTATSIHCSGEKSAMFALSVVGVSLGGTFFLIGLPLLICAIVFRSVAKACRKEDEAQGISYDGFPYGK